jgi:hypothetical protein
MARLKHDAPFVHEGCTQKWSWFFDQFYAAQRSGMVFISRGKFCVWFSISINLVRGHQTVG